GSFVTRQYVLTGFDREPALLSAVSVEMAHAGGLVSFNGRSFDTPILDTRFLFHRLEWAGSTLPHLHVLHPARRFWRPGPGRGTLPGGQGIPGADACCPRAALERVVLEAGRGADVPGIEIPARFFRFLRTKDPRPLFGVLEQNRRDLLALAALTARLLH